MDLRAGFWRIELKTIDIRPCPLHHACKGGHNSSCKDGYTSILCAVCDAGRFFDPDTSTCVECGGNVEQGAILTSPVVILSSIILLLTLMGGVSAFLTKKRSPENSLTIRNANKQRTMLRRLWDKLKQYRTAGKIIVSFLQIVTGMSFNIDIEFPPLYTKVVSSFSFVSFTVLPSLGLECRVQHYTYLDETMVTVLGPLVLGFLIQLACWLHTALTVSRVKVVAIRKYYTYAQFLLSYIVFLGVSTALFHVFKVHSPIPPPFTRPYLTSHTFCPGVPAYPRIHPSARWWPGGMVLVG